MEDCVTLTELSGETVIKLTGDFNHGMHSRFMQVLSIIPPDSASNGKRCIIDMSETTQLDFAALGMLLVIFERVGRGSPCIAIAHPNPQVMSALKTARLDKLFTII